MKQFIIPFLSILLTAGLFTFDMFAYYRYNKRGLYDFISINGTNVLSVSNHMYYVVQKIYNVSQCTNQSLIIKSENNLKITNNNNPLDWLLLNDRTENKFFLFTYWWGVIVAWFFTFGCNVLELNETIEDNNSDSCDRNCCHKFFIKIFKFIRSFILKSTFILPGLLLYSFEYDTPCLEGQLFFWQKNLINDSALYLTLISVCFIWSLISSFIIIYDLSQDDTLFEKMLDNIDEGIFLCWGSILIIGYSTTTLFTLFTYTLSFYNNQHTLVTSIGSLTNVILSIIQIFFQNIKDCIC
ncbi:unnamed protein product [Didymodactylos carnosus]|nr:unnamed protein product [Didymodactylos carnosus]CAF4023145.1 unnamed protein product [Didymodactylos carnosus]